MWSNILNSIRNFFSPPKTNYVDISPYKDVLNNTPIRYQSTPTVGSSGVIQSTPINYSPARTTNSSTPLPNASRNGQAVYIPSSTPERARTSFVSNLQNIRSSVQPVINDITGTGNIYKGLMNIATDIAQPGESKIRRELMQIINPQYSGGQGLREMAGGAVGTLGTALNLPELNVSEMIFPKAVYADNGGNSMNTSTQYGRQTDRGNQNPQFIYDNEGNPIGSKTKTVISSTPDRSTDLSGISTGLTDTTSRAKQTQDWIDKQNGTEDIYGWTTDEQNRINQIMDLYNKGEIDDKQAEEEQRKIQDAYNQRVYNDLIASYQSDIPFIKQDLETETNRLKGYMGDVDTEATNQNVALGNQYGELIRRIAANKGADTTNLKNVFSALGTAESSAFINKMGDLERAAGDQQTATEREQLAKQTANTTEATRVKRDYQGKIDAATNEANRLINDVEKNVRLTEGEKAGKLAQINIDFANAIRNIKSFYTTKKAELLAGQQDTLNARKNIILQGDVQDSLNKKLYQYQSQANQIIPMDVANEMIKSKQSGMSSAKLAELLKQSPIWQQMWNDLVTGKIDENYITSHAGYGGVVA